MAVYALSGGATGIGAAIKEQLRARGDQVIVVDLREGDICADLSTELGRHTAVEGVRALAPQGLDGIIPCAGLGPSVRPPSLISKVNYFAAVSFVDSLCDLLRARSGKVVMIASNSAPMVAHNGYVDLLLSGDETAACALADQGDTHSAYAGSKHALICWLRRKCLELAPQGIAINAVAPGIVDTPLSDKVLADRELGEVMQQFGESVPLGAIGRPSQIADVVLFLLSEAASYMTGSVIFVDGGHDAMLRPDSF
jgi:NAD(P)-dependent dehydrogenase (short-subunit alcohol dehydrogenase family)